MNIPTGYFSSEHALSSVQVARLKHAWGEVTELWQQDKPAALVLDAGITFVPLSNGSVELLAICRYCNVVNINSSIWCPACGAPMTKE